jgi:hypothetical protein
MIHIVGSLDVQRPPLSKPIRLLQEQLQPQHLVGVVLCRNVHALLQQLIQTLAQRLVGVVLCRNVHALLQQLIQTLAQRLVGVVLYQNGLEPLRRLYRPLARHLGDVVLFRSVPGGRLRCEEPDDYEALRQVPCQQVQSEDNFSNDTKQDVQSRLTST